MCFNCETKGKTPEIIEKTSTGRPVFKLWAGECDNLTELVATYTAILCMCLSKDNDAKDAAALMHEFIEYLQLRDIKLGLEVNK